MKSEMLMLLALLTNLVVVITTGSIVVGRVRQKQESDAQRLSELSGKLDIIAQNAVNAEARMIGKITDVEIWARDTFVRRDSFFAVTKDLKQDFNVMLEKMEKKLEDLMAMQKRRDDERRHQ